MINLDVEAHRYKLKLFNIFWQHFKYGVTVFILYHLSQAGLTPQYSAFLQLAYYTTLAQMVFNLLTFVYLVYIRDEFPRVEYFLIYAFNLFVFFSMLIVTLKVFAASTRQDASNQQFLRAYIFLLLQKEIEILLIMIFPFDISNRQVNIFTSNICVFLLLSTQDTDKCEKSFQLTSFGIMVVNIISFMFFTLFNLIIYRYQSMKQQIRNFIKQYNLKMLILYLQFNFRFVIACLDIFISCSYPQQITSQLPTIIICLLGLYIHSTRKLNIRTLHSVVRIFVITVRLRNRIANQIESSFEIQTQTLFFINIVVTVDANQHFMVAGPHKFQNQQAGFYNNQYSKKLSSLKSQQSQPNILIQSLKNQQQPQQNPVTNEEKKEKGQPVLEKLGTSQFGNEKNQMLHSWANITNNNPFAGQQTESMIQVQVSKELSEKQRTLLEQQSRVSREGRNEDDSFNVANPMESGSQLTIK